MQDLKHAFRLLLKSPAFTAIVVITLALGIGANTAVFSIIHGTLLHPLPYKNPDRLIDILDSSIREKELARIFASYSDYDEFSRHSQTLESIGAETWAGRPGVVLTGRGPAKSYLTIPVTVGFFSSLGVPAQRGRTFATSDLRGGCAVVLSDKFWRGPAGSDPHIIGQSLSLDYQSCAVIGVMPARFAAYPPETQIWTLILPNDPRLRTYFGVFMIARLRPGVSIWRARAELTALHTALHARDSSGEKQFTPLVSRLQDQFTWLAGRNLQTTLIVLFASVFLVLCIACLNIANLLLARSFARGREFAIRLALGSGGQRLLRQLLIESAVLSLAGGALGLLVAFAATHYFVHLQPVELPVGSNISINLPALAFAALVSIVTALIFAVMPAWAVSLRDVHAGLRLMGGDIAPARQHLSRILVGAEMAMSVVLLVGAGLLMRSVLGFESAPLGFARENIAVSNGSLPSEYHGDAPRKVAFYEKLSQQLASVPGITSAAIASTLPPYGLGLGTVEIEGKPVPRDLKAHDVGDVAVSTDYFAVLDVSLRSGRTFTLQDQPRSEHLALVNEAFARAYFSDRNPIGQKIRIGDEQEWVTVIGVVGDEKRPNVYQEMKWLAQPLVYRPLAQHPPDYFAVAVRGAVAQKGIGHEIERAVASIDSQAALDDIKSMESRLSPYLNYPRFRATLLAAFSLLAAMLAALGLYGVLAQFVAQRTREIGLRMAVGATGSDVAGLIAWRGGVPVFAGLCVGFALSFALTRYLQSLLYGVSPTDPGTLILVAFAMIGITLLAMILPARRASRVDPVTALRTE